MTAFTFLLRVAGLPVILGVTLLLCGQTGRGTASAVTDWLHEVERSNRIDADRSEFRHYYAVNDVINCDLIEGRVSLREAVAAMRAEQEDRPPGYPSPVEGFPGRSVEERYMRLAILRTSNRLGQSSRKGEVLQHLHAELQALGVRDHRRLRWSCRSGSGPDLATGRCAFGHWLAGYERLRVGTPTPTTAGDEQSPPRGYHRSWLRDRCAAVQGGRYRLPLQEAGRAGRTPTITADASMSGTPIA